MKVKISIQLLLITILTSQTFVCADTGADIGIKLYNNREYSKSFDWFTSYLSSGRKDHTALYYLGRMYYQGRGVDIDLHKSELLLQKASHLGSSEAGLLLGQMYHAGIFGTKNCKKTVEYLLESAEHNNNHSQYLLSTMLLEGDCFEYDYKLGVKWLKESANNGFGPAQYNLAIEYGQGKIGPNIEKSVHWFKKAADNGVVQAQRNIGIILMKGIHCEKNPSLALEYITKSALSGYVPSMLLLGDIYFEGLTGKLDHDEAKKWYITAAQNGDLEAHRKLQAYFNINK